MPSFNLQMGGLAPTKPTNPNLVNTQGPIGRNFFSNQASPTTNASSPLDPSSNLMNQYKLYDTAVGQSAAAYDTINQGYQNLANTNTPVQGKSFTPQQYSYSPTANFNSSMSNLQDLSKTGGYSDSDIANLRARGISPIRAIYANAQRNIDRQRSLQGGYSPNYTAATAKLTRDLSQDVSDATQNVEAGIAQQRAGNRIGIAGTLASAAGNENALQNQYGSRAADIANEAQQYNIGNELDLAKYNNNSDLQRRLASLEGMKSLYGTTPALAALFGNQAMQAANMAQDSVQNQTATGTNLARLIAGGYR